MPADERPRGGRKRPDQRGGQPGQPGRDSRSGRSGKPASRDARPSRDDRSSRDDRAGRDRGKDRTRSTAGRWRRDELPPQERTAVQSEYDGPPIPDEITGRELDRHVQSQLKSLPEKLAARVARHLVAAAQLMESDPETA